MTAEGDPRRLRRPARRRGHAAPRGRGPRPQRGRLAGRHERHPRGHHQGRLGAQGALAGPGPDADAGADREPRPGHRRLRARGLLGGRGRASRPPPARLRRPLARGLHHPPQGGRAGRGHRRRRRAAPPASSRRSRPSRRSSSRRCSTTSPRCSARPTAASASRPRRTLRAAQALYDQHKLLTYPRTNSRYLSGDMAGQLKPVASGVGAAAPRVRRRRRATCSASTGCRSAGWSTTPASRTTTRSSPPRATTTCRASARDERRIYDMVARRFLAVFHPPARFERTAVETRVRRAPLPQPRQGPDRGRLARRLRRGGRAGRRRPPTARPAPTEEEREQALPALEVGQQVACAVGRGARQATKPPARYSEGTLLRAMETAGKLVDDDEAAEAMKDAGIGTPATRAATIERLVDAEYVEREGRGLRATEKGVGLITMLGDHLLTSPELTGRWEQRLNRIERGEEQADDFRREIDGFTREVVDVVRRQGARRPARRAQAARALPHPGLRGPDRRVPQELRLQHVPRQGRPGLRLHALEAAERPHDHPRGGARAHRRRPLQQGPGERARDASAPAPPPAAAARSSSARAATAAPAGRAAPSRAAATSSGRRCAARRARSTPRPPARWWPAARPTPRPPASKEPLGACPTPGCGGQIVENSRAYGCTSWKSRKNPGCGFVIWKREKGHEVTREEAAARLEEAARGRRRPRPKVPRADGDDPRARSPAHPRRAARVWTLLARLGPRRPAARPRRDPRRADRAAGRPSRACPPRWRSGWPRGSRLDRRPLRLSSQAQRSRERNREIVLGRLERRVAAALAPAPPPRRPTRPTRAAASGAWPTRRGARR